MKNLPGYDRASRDYERQLPPESSDIDFDDLPDSERDAAYESLREWINDGNIDSIAEALESPMSCNAADKAWERIKAEACENHVDDDPDEDAADIDDDR